MTRQTNDMWCHSCEKNFIASVDVSVEGNHEISCPHCSHLHYRVVTNGIITGERFSSDHSENPAQKSRTWKSPVADIETTSRCDFLRSRWLDRFEGSR